MLSAKQQSAQSGGISLEYELSTLAATSELPPLKGVDIVRFTGNLLDNAMDEVSQLPLQEREVKLVLSVQSESLTIRSINRCRQHLSAEQLRRIFQPGFSTKSDGHSGLGLAVVQERARFYQGKAWAVMEDGLLVINVALPCKAKMNVDPQMERADNNSLGKQTVAVES